MRRLIFLDFDGVLHADGETQFARLALFERFDEGCPNLVVVPSERGFGDVEGNALLAWYAAAGSGAPTPTAIV